MAEAEVTELKKTQVFTIKHGFIDMVLSVIDNTTAKNEKGSRRRRMVFDLLAQHLPFDWDARDKFDNINESAIAEIEMDRKDMELLIEQIKEMLDGGMVTGKGERRIWPVYREVHTSLRGKDPLLEE